MRCWQWDARRAGELDRIARQAECGEVCHGFEAAQLQRVARVGHTTAASGVRPRRGGSPGGGPPLQRSAPAGPVPGAPPGVDGGTLPRTR